MIDVCSHGIGLFSREIAKVTHYHPHLAARSGNHGVSAMGAARFPMAKNASTATSTSSGKKPAKASAARAAATKSHASHEHPLRRLAALRKGMAKAEVPLLLVTNPKDVGYLTGCHVEDSWLLVGADARSTVLISDFRFQEELEVLGDGTVCRVVIRSGSIIDELVRQVGELKAKRLGVQGENLTVARLGAIGQALGNACTLVPTSGLVSSLRATKDATEIALISKAIAIQEKALNLALAEADGWMKQRGVFTESQFAACLEYHMRVLGSSAPSFETIAGAGPNGSLPHYRAAAGKVRKGVPLLIDWGATYQGYHGDMTRVVCWGTWPKEIEKIFKIAHEAHDLAVETLRVGVNSKVVDAAARDHIAKAGYGPQFGHSLGHGLGLDVHEEPGLRSGPVAGAGTDLREGMVVTIEPGIYLPGLGGVRLEDDYVIRGKGCENLCSMKMGLKWSTR
jgi:Xaa-Pro aminopeptidase